jgi:hypothetical protein
MYKFSNTLNPQGSGVRVAGDKKLGAGYCRRRPGPPIHLGTEVYAGPTTKLAAGTKNQKTSRG